MIRSAQVCVAVAATFVFVLLTFVMMMPVQSSRHGFENSTPNRPCRYQLHINADPNTKKLESKFTLDEKKLKSVLACDITFASDMDANSILNKGMINYGIAVGLESDGIINGDQVQNKDEAGAVKRLYRGAIIKCGNIESCVTVVDETETTDSPARRRLLSMGHGGTPLPVMGYPLGGVVASCGFLLIFVTFLCACHEKKQRKQNIRKESEEQVEEDVTLNNVTLRGSGAAYADPHNGTVFYAVPSKTKEEPKRSKVKEERRNEKEEPRRNGKEDNGALGHKRDDSRGSRCATLDRRLPAPPTSAPDDPDDLDPTYDIIPGEKREDPRQDSDSQSYEPFSRIYAVPEEKKSSEIVYEEVQNRRQSLTEDVMERASMMEVSIHSVHSVHSHSTRQSYFSDSDERPRSNLSRLSVEHYASPDEARGSGETTPVAARNSFPGSLYEDEFTDPPPVPDRRYGEDEIINSGILPEDLLQPYVPPRIAAAAFPLLAGSEVAVPALPTIAPAPIVPVIATVPVGPVMDYQEPSDPRYIQVTARESMASILARQALQRHDYDNFYEPIDGDDPPPVPVRPISPPRASLDMYGGADYDEINYAVPGNGNDDQGDTGLYSDIKEPGAPGTPPSEPPRVPPLHAQSLTENSSIIYADADSPLLTRRSRANTTDAATNVTRDPIYAVPHKERRREPEAAVYAQVDKARKQEDVEPLETTEFDVRAPLAKYDAETSFDKSPSNGSFDGVRSFESRVRAPPEPPEPPSDRISVDSGLYQRVDIEDKVKPETRYSNLSEDANYSVIPLEEKTLAREQMFHMSNHQVPDNFWVKQEHIYQDLDEEMNFPKPLTVL